MESIARVFSSSDASKIPPALRAELTATAPLVWEEALYASYIKKDPKSYTHNSTRASIAVTASYRLVVVAAGHKQIDLLMPSPKGQADLQVWTEKNNTRIHFKIDLGFYEKEKGDSSLEIRAETQDAGRILRIIEERFCGQGINGVIPQQEPPPYSAIATASTAVVRRSVALEASGVPFRFPKHLRDEILAANPTIFEENLPATTVLRRTGESFQNTTKVCIAITQLLRFVIVPQGENYSDFPLTTQWCREALRVWLEDNGGVIGFEIKTAPFRRDRQDEVREIRVQAANASQIRDVIRATS